ncbi:MAG: cobalamin-binding protein [Nitrospira sp.]|nr:cobalamin-binding protein [Nitrospira sp.]
MRICSLVPGATEVVAALGLADQLVGISHECDFPPNLPRIPVMVRARIESRSLSSAQIDAQVGSMLSAGEGLYELDEPRLLAAKPELFITQDLCDVCAITPSQLAGIVRKLAPPPRLVTLNPRRLDDILQDIATLGIALEREEAGAQFAAQLRGRLEAVRKMVSTASTRPRVACLEWLSPLYTAGHWVPDMVAAAGGIDVLAEAGAASHRIEWDMLAESEPDVIVLMPCGFTVARTKMELAPLTSRPEWKDLPAVRRGQVYLVDALSYFSRPGPRLIDGVEQLAAVFHPACFHDRLPPAIEPLTPHGIPTPMTR